MKKKIKKILKNHMSLFGTEYDCFGFVCGHRYFSDVNMKELAEEIEQIFIQELVQYDKEQSIHPLVDVKKEEEAVIRRPYTYEYKRN